MKTLISASMLAADMLRLGEMLESLDASGVDMLHYDVMDGAFVDNITYGELILSSIYKKTRLPLDVHLMTENPRRLINGFREAGASLITFHIESASPVAETIKEIKNSGIRAGIAVKPLTPIEEVFPFVGLADMILIMTVEPGRGGQPFIPETMDKVVALKKYIDENKLSCDIQVDGGINAITGKKALLAGANVLVAGTYLFGAENICDAVKALRND